MHCEWVSFKIINRNDVNEYVNSSTPSSPSQKYLIYTLIKIKADPISFPNFINVKFEWDAVLNGETYKEQKNDGV